jgi:hypothetical protein
MRPIHRAHHIGIYIYVNCWIHKVKVMDDIWMWKFGREIQNICGKIISGRLLMTVASQGFRLDEYRYTFYQ